MKITVKSKINKNRCKNLTHLQVFTGQLRCLDVLNLDQLFKPDFITSEYILGAYDKV
jgi:hypothetical protein